MRTTVKVVSTGKGGGASNISRYIAERDRDLEREGKEPRPLFDEKEDRLTYRQADNVLSRGQGAPAKVDVLHVVVSLRPGDYERFGESDEERTSVFRSVVRDAMRAIERELHAEDLRWFAGIHLNTDNPHIHLAISKEMTDAENGTPKRLENIPRDFKPHYEKAQEKLQREHAPENESKTLTDALARNASAVEADASSPTLSPREGERGERGIVYLNVTSDDPCPVCHKPDYCSVVGDGASVFCRRVPSERPGHGGWWHKLSEPIEAFLIDEAHKVTQNPPASIQQRDAVHGALIDHLRLSSKDRINLNERGLDDATIKEYGYASVPSRADAPRVVERLLAQNLDLKNVPGFYRPEDGEAWSMNVTGWHQGFMVPVRDVENRIEGFQIRRSDVKTWTDVDTGKEKKEPRYVWLSSANKQGTSKTPEVIRPDGASSGTPVHYRNVERMRATGEAILTEGALKADIIVHYLDRGVIGVAGVGNFPKDFGAELRQKLPELRRVLIAYDADVVRKPEVQTQLERLQSTLTEAGLEVQVGRWQEHDGKGLDDYCKNKLGPDFRHTARADRAERQLEVLRAIGWSERAAGENLAPEVDEQRSEKGRLMPGVIADRFLEAMGRHTEPVHAIGFRLADKELLMRREIVGEINREPTTEERLVGRWIIGETAHRGDRKGYETPAERAERLSLQWQVRELDHTAHERGEPLTAAYIPAKELSDAIAERRIAALHLDGRLPRTFETPIVEATLTPAEKRKVLGAELTARLEVEYWSGKLQAAEEQGAVRRYRAHDPTTETSRRISQHDIEQRAKAGAYQEANASQPETAAERAELRQNLYHADVKRHQETTETIDKRHKKQVEAVRAEHTQALCRLDELAPKAAGIERQLVAAGEPLPTPIIARDVLDRLHEQAVERRDTGRITTLDRVRHRLAEEFGGDAHTDKSAARLEAHRSVAARDLAVTDRRIENFEQSRHQRQWDFGDEKWSLSDVDRELSRSARDIDFNERRNDYFENRLSWRGLLPHPSQLNPFRNPFHISPSKLSPLPPALNPNVRARYREEMEAGREAIHIAQEKIEKLTPLREEVVKRMDAHRGELHAEKDADREMVETLSAIRSREAVSRETRGARMPEPVYTSWELRRLETNAALLRDGDDLREYERAAGRAIAQQADPDTAAAKTRDRLAGRAFAREIVAEIDSRDATARARQFDEHRAGARIVYKDGSGEDRTATLRDVQPKGWLDRLTRHFTETAEERELRQTVERAVAETYSALLDNRDAAQSYLKTVSDVANEYREGLRAIDPQRVLPAPQFTENEIAKIERFGKGLEVEVEREQIKDMVLGALHESRVGNHPLGKDFADHARVTPSLKPEQSWERIVESNRDPSRDLNPTLDEQAGRTGDVGQPINRAAEISLVL
ncbi:MAG: DUF3854 domain-containing protein [Pyrinomonadaceae bacterium]|nr:DUF3854 domain-containing protein [Pyrinomonadaceae bacterium]